MARALAVILFLLASVAHAQLATNYDGSDLLLATSWKLRGAPETPGPSAIHRLREGRWSVIAKATGNVNSPSLSSDGSLVAWERYFPCSGSCMLAVPRSTSEAEGLRSELKINSYMVFYSPNGRFAVTPGFHGFTPWAMQDLETGNAWTSASAPITRVQSVSDNGTLLGVQDDQVAVWRPGGDLVRLMPAPETAWMQISADSTAVVIETGRPDEERALGWIDTASGWRRTIAQWPAQRLHGPLYFNPLTRRVSDDGRHVLYFDDPYLKLDDKVVARIPEGLWHAALSGSGRVAYALTLNGRLLKIDTDTAEATELTGALPLLANQVYGGAVPGSALQIAGVGSFAGLRFTIDGADFPAVETDDPRRGYVQIPWEFSAPERGIAFTLTMQREGSPFEFPISVFIASAPSAHLSIRETDRQAMLKAVLPDWTGLVTEQTPALPGTTIHAYMLGLGPLDRPVATGQRGPSDPPARPLARIACYIRGADDNPMPRGLELPFVAYAPGLVGVYQVDMTIPAGWPAGRSLINCEGAGYTDAWIDVGTVTARP